jgi:hypothetical protein
MRHLHRRRHSVQDDDLVTPVELQGLARREDQRHICIGDGAAPLFLKGPRMLQTELWLPS